MLKKGEDAMMLRGELVHLLELLNALLVTAAEGLIEAPNLGPHV